MSERIRAYDWSGTPLGPSTGWSERLKLTIEQVLASPLASLLVCGPHRALIFNDAAMRLEERFRPATVGRPACEAWKTVWPTIAPHCELAFAGEVVRLAAAPRRAGDEGDLTALPAMVILPVHETDDRVAYVHLTCLPADEQADEALRAGKVREAQLLWELQRRSRNLLAVVRAVVARTGALSDNVDDFAAHLTGRVDALARTQSLLTLGVDAMVNLELLIREELLAQAAPENRLDIGGPDVCLPAKAAEVLTLALHELATNAVKFGALASPMGSIKLRWTLAEENDARWLTLVWEETGVRVATLAPRREGFGTELIERRIAYELRGRGSLRLQPGGVYCEISVPIAIEPALVADGTPATIVERDF